MKEKICNTTSHQHKWQKICMEKPLQENLRTERYPMFVLSFKEVHQYNNHVCNMVALHHIDNLQKTYTKPPSQGSNM